jgi:hypothetical protein
MNLDKQIYDSGLIADGCWDQLDQYAKDAIMKFGELIVLECAGLCDLAAEESARTVYTVTETKELGPALVAKGGQFQAERLSKQIKNYFQGGA